MKISFLSPFPNLSGGVRVVANYASLLSQRGHEVEVICAQPTPRTLRSKARGIVEGFLRAMRGGRGQTHFERYGVKYRVVDHPGPIVDSDVPEGDVVIATWWETAHWVARLNEKKGVGVYFMQDYEMPHLPLTSLLPTFDLGLRIITISHYCDSLIQQHASQGTVVVLNAIGEEYWMRQPSSPPRENRFGFVWSGNYLKGADTCVEAVRLASEKIDAEWVCFGRPQRRPRMLEDVEQIQYHPNPSDQEAISIFRSCRAWLFGTRREGFGLPILEAMACRTPVIGTSAGPRLNSSARGGGSLLAQMILRLWRQLSSRSPTLPSIPGRQCLSRPTKRPPATPWKTPPTVSKRR